MRSRFVGHRIWRAVAFAAVAMLPLAGFAEEGENHVEGTLTANGQTVELGYVYVFTEESWEEEGEAGYAICLTDVWVPLQGIRKLRDRKDVNYLKLYVGADGSLGGKEFHHQGMERGPLSGGVYEEKLELTSLGPELFAGRTYVEEPRTFFDDTYEYEATFRVRLPAGAEVGGGPVPPAPAGEDGVKGTLTANDQTVNLEHVYIHTEENPFDDEEPGYVISLTDAPVPYEELEDLWKHDEIHFVQVHVGSDGSVYSCRIQHDAMGPESVSGGGSSYLMAFSHLGPDVFAGRAYLAEPEEFFGDTYHYDATFKVTLAPPPEPTGEPLPAGGGEPGQAYAAWVAAVSAGDVAALKKIVPPEIGADLDGEEGAELLEMVQAMTPSEVTILGGRLDGEEAVLEVEAVLAGDKVSGEITMVRRGDFWVPANAEWK